MSVELQAIRMIVFSLTATLEFIAEHFRRNIPVNRISPFLIGFRPYLTLQWKMFNTI